MRAGIAVDEPIHANLDPSAGDMLPQAIDPVPVDGRHPDAHGKRVSYRLLVSSVGSRPIRSASGGVGRPRGEDPETPRDLPPGPPLENAAQKAKDAPS
jgi:hypothetical protein